MKLAHYSEKKFTLDIITDYPQKGDMKPNGFWLSIEDKENDFYDWSDWCKSEEFHLTGLKHRYFIEIDKDAKVLELVTNNDVIKFHEEYAIATYRIDWNRVAKFYQAIFIYPYKWSLRLDGEVSWYYTWDCSSGCIWNLNIVNKIELDKEYKYEPRNLLADFE